MTKIEKKQLLEDFKKTEQGKSMMQLLYRLRIIGGLASLYVIIYFLVKKNIGMVDLLLLLPLSIAAVLFIMMSFKLQKKVLTNFAVKK